METIGPQPGPQTAFAACPADICIFGGEAGGGKSDALLQEALKWVKWPGYEAVILRRNHIDLKGAGGLWKRAKEIYRPFGATFREGQYMDAVWPESNSVIQFTHMHEEAKLEESWQGRQLAFVGIDEATHFTERQFWYIYTRLRTTCGMTPYLRATCNPDPDSFLAKLLSWWIDQETGYPLPERDGVIRWLCRLDDDIYWFDSKEECQEYLNEIEDLQQAPISFTFIRSRLSDNPALTDKDPGYAARIAVQGSVDRERLGKGNWKIKAQSGSMFNRAWFDVIDVVPPMRDWAFCVRAWDKAATKPNFDNKDPDWTRGVKLIKLKNGHVIVADVVSLRDTPGKVDELMIATAKADGSKCPQALWQDPGASGVSDKEHTIEIFRKKAPNVRLVWQCASKNKVAYAKPVSAWCDPMTSQGVQRMHVLNAHWTSGYLAELDNFPPPPGVAGKGKHDDQVDATSRGWIELEKGRVGTVARFLSGIKAARA